MSDWIKKHKGRIIAAGIFLLIGIPFGVHCLYKLITPTGPFWVPEWSAGDLITYYGSVLSFAATAFLGVLALWQNEMIQKESTRHTQFLVEMDKNKTSPFFTVDFVSESIRHSSIKIRIANISDNIAVDLTINELNGSFRGIGQTQVISCGTMAPGNVMEVNLNNGFLKEDDTLEMQMKCRNVYGDDVIFSVRGMYTHDTKEFKMDVKRISAH